MEKKMGRTDFRSKDDPAGVEGQSAQRLSRDADADSGGKRSNRGLLRTAKKSKGQKKDHRARHVKEGGAEKRE